MIICIQYIHILGYPFLSDIFSHIDSTLQRRWTGPPIAVFQISYKLELPGIWLMFFICSFLDQTHGFDYFWHGSNFKVLNFFSFYFFVFSYYILWLIYCYWYTN